MLVNCWYWKDEGVTGGAAAGGTAEATAGNLWVEGRDWAAKSWGMRLEGSRGSGRQEPEPSLGEIGDGGERFGCSQSQTLKDSVLSCLALALMRFTPFSLSALSAASPRRRPPPLALNPPSPAPNPPPPWTIPPLSHYSSSPESTTGTESTPLSLFFLS
ncbi:hypothetical protein Acr_25g0004840 [Actinidia rufa]|uniref:Uncharacterized protein n=1 Tax=Actinidia rufa TaxID=165716 RepID=A0A7J0GZ16_9ERIC|nr:hypothetical protein Acr_25g0004840 [Actinidia rufa]